MKARNENLFVRLQNLPPATATALGLFYSAVVGIADFYTPPRMSFTFFYLFGVIIIGWCASSWLAVTVTAIASGLIMAYGFTIGHPRHSIWILLWNESTCFLFIAATGWLAAKAGEFARGLSRLVEERTAKLRSEAEQHKATAATLAETVERFEQVINNITEVFWLSNVPKNEMAYVSPGYERIWGRKCDDLYRDPQSWVAAIHPDDRQGIERRSLTEQLADGYDVEYRILRPDGVVRWIRDRAFPVRNNQGEVYRIAGIAEDITERKRTGELLQTQAAILENMAEGVVVTDEQGKIVQMNPAAERIWGYARNEVLGQPASVFSALPEPEATAVMQEVLAALQATGSWRGTFKNRCKDGAIIFCEAVINRLEVQGRMLMVAVEQDVTERKQAEQALREAHDQLERRVQERTAELQAANTALRESEARLRMALDASNAGTWSWDAATNTSEWDDCYRELYGFEPHHPASFDAWITQMHPEDRPGLRAQIQKLQEPGAGSSWNVEFRVLHPVKGERWMAGLGRIERDETGRAVRFGGINFDITERKRTEQALRESEVKYRRLYESMTDAVVKVDMTGRIIEFNPAYQAMLGYTADELGQLTYIDLTPEEWQAFEARFVAEQTLPRGYSDVYEKEYQRKDGTIFPVEMRTFLIRDAHGQPAAMWAIVRDITRRKLAEAALREAHDTLEARVKERTAELETANAALAESEERYRSLVTNLNVGVYRNTPGPHGRFLHVNPALARIQGYDSVEEFQGLRVDDTYQEPGDRQAFLAELYRHGSVTNHELRLRKKDGTPIYCSVNATVHRGPNGEVDWIDGALEDITESKRAQEALRASEERYRTLAESSPDAIFILDRDIRVRYVNSKAAALWRRQPQDLIGLPQAELFSTETAQNQASVVRSVFETGNPIRREKPLAFPVGDKWIEIRLAPLYDAQGTVTSVMGICRDITERKRAEQQLSEALDLNQKMIAASTVGVAAYQASGECVFANEALAGMAGGSPSELHQSDFRRLEFWRESGLLQLAEEVLSQGQARSGEIFGTTRFGKGVSLDCHLAPFVSNGQPHLLLMALDISERKRAESLLQAQRDLAMTFSLTSDLQADLERLLEIAMQTGGVDAGGVYLLNDATGGMDIAVHRGGSRAFIKTVSHWAPDGPQMQLMRQGRPVFAPYGDLPLPPDPVRRSEGLRATALVPFCHNGKAIGALALSSHESDEVPPQTQLVIEAIAAQAAGAIARIRAETALRESETRLRAIITGAPVLLFAVDQDGIIRFEDGQGLNALGATQGANLGRSVMEVYAHLPTLLENARRALRGEEFEAIVEAGPTIFDCWYSPTRDKDGKSTGYIGVATNISERHHLERRLLEISDREHARIGQDLHDGLCQHLVSLAFDANSLQSQLVAARRPEAKTARRIADYLDRAITEARQLSRGLFPVRMEKEGLPSALEELARTTRERFGIPCRFDSKGPARVKNSSVATHLYRIAQEAVTNAVKHSQASRLSISLRARPDQLELRVEDNGAGFSPATRRKATGMGLHIMDYRARTIGGTLRISPRRRGGTQVSCCVFRARQ